MAFSIMETPQIEYLLYEISCDEYTEYRSQNIREYEVDDWKCEIADGKVKLFPKTEYEAHDDALVAAEEFVRCWTIMAQLWGNLGCFELNYKSMVFYPTQGEEGTIYPASASLKLSSSMSAIAHVIKSQYPAPPQRSRITPELEVMFLHDQMVRSKKAFLGPSAYFCLTVLELQFEERSEISKALRISGKILGNLGSLTTKKGGASGRKAKGIFLPYSREEELWLREVMKELVQRKFQYDIGDTESFQYLTMADLPKLPE